MFPSGAGNGVMIVMPAVMIIPCKRASYKKSGPKKEKAMSIFYSLAYSIGFAPWEKASTHRPAAQQVKALFDDRR